MDQSDQINAPIKTISRKSPHQEWVDWAQHFVEKYPESTEKNYFCSYFTAGLATQNLMAVKNEGLFPGFPNPDSRNLKHSNNYLDVPTIIIMMDRIGVPSEAREIVLKKLYNDGRITEGLDLIKHYIPRNLEF